MIITDLMTVLANRNPNRIVLAAPKSPLVGVKSSVRNKMRRAYKHFAKEGNINLLSMSMRAALDNAYAEAYMVGKKTNVVAKGELKWINKQKRKQFEFLDGFMSDLHSGEGVMSPYDRIDAYVKKLDSMYWSGMVAGADEDSELNWMNDPRSANCDGCEDYAAGSPYPRGELDAVPGDGSTECGFNCNCWLEAV